jgi:hypothetical protein
MSEVVWPLAEALRTETIQARDGLAALMPGSSYIAKAFR